MKHTIYFPVTFITTWGLSLNHGLLSLLDLFENISNHNYYQTIIVIFPPCFNRLKFICFQHLFQVNFGSRILFG